MAGAGGRSFRDIVCDAGAGASAGAIAATVVCPLDVIKTRLQVGLPDAGRSGLRGTTTLLRKTTCNMALSLFFPMVTIHGILLKEYASNMPGIGHLLGALGSLFFYVLVKEVFKDEV
ncbi:hypothetical protein RJ639_026365 [Escallonia herrerae]|uniref:Uncharacterized protein n=1 Tax=Escallonia herrerae TaxID=1293975 RepID=A0AA88UY24_9ASTE|nr:hypothetical protein RJ639_026365 [Escallonia herrerae]